VVVSLVLKHSNAFDDSDEFLNEERGERGCDAMSQFVQHVLSESNMGELWKQLPLMLE